MSDLRTHPRLTELLDHLREKEDAVGHFYCDHNGLVTIGVGHLVDVRGAADVIAVGQATALARRNGVRFYATGQANARQASIRDVEADWQRVKTAGRQHPEWRAPRFANIAQLRLDNDSVNALLNDRVQDFLNQLYERRPFVLRMHVAIAMALVDVRYNPARVVLYGTDPDIQTMWNTLDPSSDAFDLNTAVPLFERIWANRGRERYGLRHYERTRWLREGIAAMGGADGMRRSFR